MNDALKAYLDGEATPAEAKAVEAALESDASLQASRSQFEALSSVLRHESVEPRPIGFERTLMALAETERVTKRPSWLVWAPRVIAAAAICGVVAFPAFFVNDQDVANSAKKTDFVAMKSKDADMSIGSKLYSPDVAGTRSLESMRDEAKMAPPVEAEATLGSTMMYAPDRNQTTIQGAPGIAQETQTRNRSVPALPRMRGSMPQGSIVPIVPDNIQALPSAGGTAVIVPEAAKVSKADLDGLEKAIRQAAASVKGQIVGVSKLANETGATGRTILVNVSAKDAAAFADRARKLIGASGSVSDPIDAAAEPRKAAYKSPSISAQASTDANQKAAADGEATDPKKRIEELKAKREELLKDFYPDAKPVKEIDEEIAEVQKKIDASNSRETAPRKLVQVTLGGR